MKHGREITPCLSKKVRTSGCREIDAARAALSEPRAPSVKALPPSSQYATTHLRKEEPA